MKSILAVIFATCVLLIAPQAGNSQDGYSLKIPAGLKKLKIPKDNKLTAEKIELGKQLFFDKRLSKDNTIACASCHDPQKGWSNGEPFATGIDKQQGGRNAPTILNAAYQYFQFWDGRAVQLEGQALGPIQNPIEMGMSLEELEKKLAGIEGYNKQFQSVFNSKPTSENVAKAIASFERTILSGDAPYDRFKAGDKSALSESAQRGMKVFFNKANCSACHVGGTLSDRAFHNIGVGYKSEDPDLGRFTVTELEGDKGSFRTPTLREIAKTAPYMHDGSLKTLDEVVDYYNKGGHANPQLDEEMFELKLSDGQKKDLVTFLKEGLSSDSYPNIKAPELPK